MHVALIIDDERLEREQAMLNRVCNGLMTEGLQVTRVVPDSVMPDPASDAERRMALAARIPTPMRVLPWMRRIRVQRLREHMEKALPDVLYAVGAGAWRLGIDLGELIERPVVLDVCSMHLASTVPRPRQSTAIASYVASTEPMAQLVRARIGTDLVGTVPVGVPLPSQPRNILSDAGEPIGISVLGRSTDVRGYENMFEGLSRFLRSGVNAQVILELRGPREHDVWRRAERLDLLKWISSIGEAASFRSLLTRCDLIILPEPMGEVRSIVVEAMAFGIPVMAVDDPAVELIKNGATAFVVPQPADAGVWERQLRRVIDDPAGVKSLGESARRFIAEHHQSSAQIALLIEVFERASSGGSFRLAAVRPGERA